MNPSYNFTEDEQNDIIDGFLYNKSTNEIRSCQCKCYRNYKNYTVLDKMPFAEKYSKYIFL